MTDAIDLSVPRFRQSLVTEIDETVILDEDGAVRGVPELRLRTGVDGIVLNDRDQVLRLQAVINRAVNQWRDAASHLP